MAWIYQPALATAALDRAKPVADVRGLIEAGPYSAEDAKAKGLIDHVGQVKEAETAILNQAGDGAKLVDLAEYRSRARAARFSAGLGGPVVAGVSRRGGVLSRTGAPGKPFRARPPHNSGQVSKGFLNPPQSKEG